MLALAFGDPLHRPAERLGRDARLVLEGQRRSRGAASSGRRRSRRSRRESPSRGILPEDGRLIRVRVRFVRGVVRADSHASPSKGPRRRLPSHSDPMGRNEMRKPSTLDQEAGGDRGGDRRSGRSRPPSAVSSSHREAPNIMLDPSADNTDVYAWTAPDAEHAITVASNWIPGQVPANGPNFFRFDDRARYYIQFDNTGDGVADIKYRFKFNTRVEEPELVPLRRPGHDGLRRSGPERDPALRRHAPQVQARQAEGPQGGRRRVFPSPRRTSGRRRSRSTTTSWTPRPGSCPAAERSSSDSATIRSTSTSARPSTRSTCAKAPETRARARMTSPGTRPPRSSSSSRRRR